ncbi:MAG: hypothetical protein ACO3EZ_19725 [Prochlorotrichaceae cyanobacterium]
MTIESVNIRKDLVLYVDEKGYVYAHEYNGNGLTKTYYIVASEADEADEADPNSVIVDVLPHIFEGLSPSDLGKVFRIYGLDVRAEEHSGTDPTPLLWVGCYPPDTMLLSDVLMHEDPIDFLAQYCARKQKDSDDRHEAGRQQVIRGSH